MKKIIFLMMLLPVLTSGCIKDATSIEERIRLLQEAYNNNNTMDFIDCFSTSADGYALLSASLSSRKASVKTYSFGSVSVSGNTASCPATFMDSSDLQGSATETFEMVEEDGDWKLLAWYEDGTQIFNKANVSSQQ